MGVPFVEVIKAGALTTVQDCGRKGYLKYGLPPSGAMDELAFFIGNCLVGNDFNQAAIELTFAGDSFRFLKDALVAITGAQMEPKLNGADCPLWYSFPIKEGDELRFSFARSGCRTYLSVAGGIDVPTVLGSKSTYLLSGIGGFKGRSLKEGDILIRGEREKVQSFYLPEELTPKLPEELTPKYTEDWKLRVILGPQDDYFSSEDKEVFLAQPYLVSPQANRMGYRLKGKPLSPLFTDIISDAIPEGAIQITGDGQPIILLKDRQTTGGYPKIATCASFDLWQMGQVKPGDRIQFKAISLEEAYRLQIDYRNRLLHLFNLLRPII